MKDPIVQATDRHHAEEADYQRRAEALTEEIYADLAAHLDEYAQEKLARKTNIFEFHESRARQHAWFNWSKEEIQAVEFDPL